MTKQELIVSGATGKTAKRCQRLITRSKTLSPQPSGENNANNPGLRSISNF
jgi:hypothetical protein